MQYVGMYWLLAHMPINADIPHNVSYLQIRGQYLCYLAVTRWPIFACHMLDYCVVSY